MEWGYFTVIDANQATMEFNYRNGLALDIKLDTERFDYRVHEELK